MSNERKRQKKREEKKKKRDAIKTKMRQQQSGQATSINGVTRLAASCPFGPIFVSPGWDDTAENPPNLVTVVVTRKLPDGRLVPGLALVDRTCLGIKNAMVMRPMTTTELALFLDTVGQSYNEDMEPCDLLLGQSIVFHAIDYARSLGFMPHPDFPAALFGPRPDTLIDTPHARPAKPLYVSGPDDDAVQIIGQLERAVGRGNFIFSYGGPRLVIPDETSPLLLEAEDIDEDDDNDID